MLVITEEIKDYIISLLLGDDNDTSLIAYTEDENYDASVIIKPSLFFSNLIYGTQESYPQTPLLMWDDVPILYGSPSTTVINGKLIIHADLIASSFFLMTRYEEIINIDNYDKHHRFMGSGSFPERAGFLERPLIDEYGKKLRHYMRMVGIAIQEPHRRGKIYLTHDIDLPWQRLGFLSACRNTIGILIRERRCAFYPILNHFGCFRINPFNTFPWLLSKDLQIKEQMSNDCEIIYFVISNTMPTRMTQAYIKDKKASQLLRYLGNNGCKIGLHLSYEAGLENDFNKIVEEKKTLELEVGNQIKYNRNHYLLSKDFEHMRNLIKVGITDDFTMGYADRVGFRLGTSRCIRWVDPEKMQLTPLKLHPLIIMDNTLCEPQYLNLNLEEAYKKIEELYNRVELVQGDFCVLFHNNTLRVGNYTWLEILYAQMIDLLLRKMEK